eukprot:6947526-Pyramimonas_sp.AAC.2
MSESEAEYFIRGLCVGAENTIRSEDKPDWSVVTDKEADYFMKGLIGAQMRRWGEQGLRPPARRAQ